MKFWQVDAFSTRLFSGNSAVVIVLERDLTDSIKQQIAMEMNVSETAFVLMKGGKVSIRWFTPGTEVNLCGHATLAAAHILWSEDFMTEEQITFQSKSGDLGVSRRAQGEYTLDFPKQEALEVQSYREIMSSIIDPPPLYIGSNGEDCIAIVESDSFVRGYSPKLEMIRKLDERGFLLSARDSSGKFDYIYRAFFPKLDIAEDPVTGSANTSLAPYWSKILSKDSLTAYQASSRGGELALDIKSSRVHITGKAKTALAGEIFVEELGDIVWR